MLAVVDEVLVDLVGDGDEVVLDADARDRLELGAREHAAGRVVRRVEQQHARARTGRGELVRVEREVRRAQRDEPPPPPAIAIVAA